VSRESKKYMERAKLAELLRNARVRKGLSQEEVAEKVGVDFRTVSRWETGKARPYGYNLRRVCELFDWKIEDLTLEDNKRVTRPFPSPVEELDLSSLGDIYSGLGKHMEAEQCYQKALVIDENALGKEHHQVASVLRNYAALLRAIQRKRRPCHWRSRRVRYWGQARKGVVVGTALLMG
jgi:transcriptional regulator with XRE-family HTH domain